MFCVENHAIIIAVIMIEFKRKKENNFWHSPFVLFLIFGFLVLFAYNTAGLIKKERETAKNKMIALGKIDELHQKEEFYNNEINKLNTSEGVEKLARSKFQIAKPGEKVVSIINDDNIKDEEVEEGHGFWIWFKNMFN